MQSRLTLTASLPADGGVVSVRVTCGRQPRATPLPVTHVGTHPQFHTDGLKLQDQKHISCTRQCPDSPLATGLLVVGAPL